MIEIKIKMIMSALWVSLPSHITFVIDKEKTAGRHTETNFCFKFRCPKVRLMMIGPGRASYLLKNLALVFGLIKLWGKTDNPGLYHSLFN